MAQDPILPTDSQTDSNEDSAPEPNQLFEGASTNAYNWRSKFTANVRTPRSAPSRPKRLPKGSRTGISVGRRSAGSEKKD